MQDGGDLTTPYRVFHSTLSRLDSQDTLLPEVHVGWLVICTGMTKTVIACNDPRFTCTYTKSMHSDMQHISLVSRPYMYMYALLADVHLGTRYKA